MEQNEHAAGVVRRAFERFERTHAWGGTWDHIDPGSQPAPGTGPVYDEARGRVPAPDGALAGDAARAPRAPRDHSRRGPSPLPRPILWPMNDAQDDAELEALRFPIGRFRAPQRIDAAQVGAWIDDIERLPRDVRRVVEGWSEARLDTAYRPGGWSVRQVLHHLADSHTNSVVRFKWALSEERPTIKAYDEGAWAELADSRAPVGLALDLLDALHARWTHLLRSLDADDLGREFVHPDSGPVGLGANVGIYAWHGRHHLAHVTSLAEREGWAR